MISDAVTEFWFAVPLLGLAFLLAVWYLILYFNSSIDKCRQCNKEFHNVDAIYLLITPLGLKAEHSACYEKRIGGKHASEEEA